MIHPTLPRFPGLARAIILTAGLALASGCKQPTQPSTAAAPASDSQLASDLSNKLAQEQALSNQKVASTVSSGVAVLTGTVDSEAAKALAGADAQTIPGIKSVVNQITVTPATATMTTPAAAPMVPERRERARTRAEREPRPRNEPAPAAQAAPPQQVAAAPAPQPVPQAPPPPPKPVVRTYTLPAGTIVPVRMTDTLQTGVTQSGSTFRGSLAADLVQDGMVVVRQGAGVTGRVIEAKDATHYTGASALTVELTRINAGNQSIALVTEPYTEQGKARGRNTAEKVGGGAALGAIIGAIAGGGKGAAIGSVAGGGIGAGANTVTRGQQVSIPSETIVRFRLSSPIQITTTSRPESRESRAEQNYSNDDNNNYNNPDSTPPDNGRPTLKRPAQQDPPQQ